MEDSTELIEATLDVVIGYLEPLLGTANCHMVDFFTADIYERCVPPEMRLEIASVGFDAALGSIWCGAPTSRCPELSAFLASCRRHSLAHLPDVCALDAAALQRRLGRPADDPPRCRALPGRSFMSPKKCHEVETMVEVASALGRLGGVSHLVDVGDGKGYLSSALALHARRPVLGVDSSPANTAGAARRVAKLARALRLPASELYRPITGRVTGDTDLGELVAGAFPGAAVGLLGLVGLHTCGDLAASCLRIFHSDPAVRTVCNVGCCYHLLSESGGGCDGFPMSRRLSERRFRLGRNARMLAAQSVERMGRDGRPPAGGDALFDRALLQVLLTRVAPATGTTGCRVGKLGGGAARAGFRGYARAALDRLGVAAGAVSDAELAALYDGHRPRLGQLRVFHSLRAQLAPVVEAVVLLDRLLYLRELGHSGSFIARLFDPVTSPRCFGLVALK